MLDTPKTLNSRRATKRQSYLPGFNTKKQPNETYDQMKQRVFVASATSNHLEEMLDFSKVSANHMTIVSKASQREMVNVSQYSQVMITPNSVSFGPQKNASVQLKQNIFKQQESGS